MLFSAITVALSLSSLLVFPLYYLRSFAYAGIAVVAFAWLSAVVVLPAVLMVLGRRVDRWDVIQGFRTLPQRRGRPSRGYRFGRHRRLVDTTGGRLSRAGDGRWHRLALFVMRRPVPLALGVVSLLLFLGSPFLGARFALPDVANLPADSESSQVVAQLRTDFPQLRTDAMYLVSAGQRLTPEQTADYAADGVDGDRGDVRPVGRRRLRRRRARSNPPPRRRLRSSTAERASWLSVGLQGDPQGAAAGVTVDAVRALDAPAPILVGGVAAHLVDTRETLGEALPWALAVVAIATLILLFLFTGSVLIPIKAVVLNLLSLTATFGAAVWIFQDGNLKWLLGDFQTNGAIELTTPILLFAIAFGLSMDYELFLLSRIKEEYQRTGDNTAAVADGPREDRPAGHFRRAAVRHRDGRLRHLAAQRAEAGGRRARTRGDDGRDADPGRAGAGGDAAGRPGQLVGAGPAAGRVPPVRPARGRGPGGRAADHGTHAGRPGAAHAPGSRQWAAVRAPMAGGRRRPPVPARPS